MLLQVNMKTPVLMGIQPTETIFSFLVRWNKLLGLATDSDMCQLVFGKSKVRIHPYLPSQLAMIEQSISGASNDLLLNHTLFPLFAFFNPRGATKLKWSMLHSKQTVTSLAGIPHARIPLAFSHKWCPECVAESIKQKGFAILHIQHQIPGVISCSWHQCNLQMLLAGENALDRHFNLIFPASDTLPSWNEAFKFAQFANTVLEICKIGFEIDLHVLYREHLSTKGYITTRGNLRLSKLQKDFSSMFENSRMIIESEAANFLKYAEFLGPLLRKRTSYPAHPLKHLIFTFWLFDADARKFKQIIDPDNVQRHEMVFDRGQNTKVLKMLKLGMSMHQIEEQTGKSRCFIRRVAELNSIEHCSNSMVYPRSVKRAVQMKAIIGLNRMEIASELAVGIGYVEQVICNTPFLSEWRKHLWHQMKIKNAIRVLLQVAKEHPDWCRTQIRMAAKAEYALLYLHDKVLLNSCLPKPRKAVPPNCK